MPWSMNKIIWKIVKLGKNNSNFSCKNSSQGILKQVFLKSPDFNISGPMCKSFSLQEDRQKSFAEWLCKCQEDIVTSVGSLYLFVKKRSRFPNFFFPRIFCLDKSRLKFVGIEERMEKAGWLFLNRCWKFTTALEEVQCA